MNPLSVIPAEAGIQKINASLWIWTPAFAGVTTLCLLLAGCATETPEVTRLSPLPMTLSAPPQCQLAAVLPDSPAQQAGLQAGDRVETVNGVKPPSAVEVADLINQSGPDLDLEITRAAPPSRHVLVKLADKRPRLGAMCDLTGWSKRGLSSAGNESVTVFGGPYALTVSGVLEKHITFVRVEVANHSGRPLDVSPSLFTAWNGNERELRRLPARDVMQRLHGEEGARLFAPSSDDPESSDAFDPLTALESPSHDKEKKSVASYQYLEANADYLRKESLGSSQIPPGGRVDGLVFFEEPQPLPLLIKGRIEGYFLSVQLGLPQIVGGMPQGDVAQFLQGQKKGTPVRLTLKDKTIFVGKFSSYDPDNEAVWMIDPSSRLLDRVAFALRQIAAAQAVEQQEH